MCLLNARECSVLRELCRLYETKYGTPASQDPNLFIFLGDSVKRKCWSAASGQLPTYRRNSGFFWSVKSKRMLTPREKLASLGWPVTPDASLAMGVPIVPVADGLRASKVVGNCMHFSSIGLIELVALASFRPVQ